MKKIISILLAVIIVFSVSVTAFAGSGTTDIKTVEKIRLDNYKNGEKIVVGVDIPEYYKVYVNGLHNEVNPVLTVSVENEDIASAKVVEDKKVCITGNKTGETILTITDADGSSSKFTVKVLPKGINSFRVTFKNIGDRIAADFLGFWMIIIGALGGTFGSIIGKLL